METISVIFSYFHKGGLVMWPLLFCSIVVIAIGIERFIFYKQACSPRSFVQAYCADLVNGDIEKGRQLAASSHGFCAEIIQRAPRQATREQLETYFSARATIAMAQLRRRLSYLSLITTLAPLLGLLGTIVGMISAFSIFNLQTGAPIAITGGIGEALIATATGLCVAIVSLVIHSRFDAAMDDAITDMELCFGATVEASTRGE